MELIVLGGSFDPPHAAHLALLSAGLAAKPKTRAVVVPAWQSPLKGLPSATAAQRLRLSRAALGTLPAGLRRRVVLDPWEARRGQVTYSYETLRRLKARNPGADLLFLAGADSWATLPRWKRPDELARLCRFVVGRRPGAPAPRSARTLPGLEVLPGTFPDLSSTGLRARLLCAEEPPEIPRAVRGLIRSGGLYGGAIRRRLAAELSAPRYHHTLAVARMAAGLARRHGLDEERAALAGLLHDCGRSVPVHRMVAECRARRLRIPAFEETARHAPILLHAYLSEDRARRDYGVRDPAVLSAVRKHTLGDAVMAALDRLVYAADACSEDRGFPEAALIRKKGLANLDDGYREAARLKLTHVLREEGWLHPLAVSVWNAV